LLHKLVLEQPGHRHRLARQRERRLHLPLRPRRPPPL